MRRDERDERMDFIALEDDLRMALCEVEELVDLLAQRVLGLQSDERLIPDFAQADARLLRERMILRHDEEHFLRPEVHPGRIRLIHRRAEADIRLAARQLLGEHRRTLLVKLDIDVRVALMELAQDQRQERVAERVQEGEMHDAYTAVVEFDLLFRQRELADHAVDVEQEFLPGLRQIRGAAMAFKQGDAELLLQFLDGSRKSRLRDGHLFGCLREVTALGHRLEVLQLCQFHFVPRFLHIVHNYFRL